MVLLRSRNDPLLLLSAADVRRAVLRRLEADAQPRRRRANLGAITDAVAWTLASGPFETDWTYLRLARALWPTEFSNLLAWRPAWFLHVEVGAAYPHFERVREAIPAGGLCLGPFADGRSARRFLSALEEVFDLCRDTACLRKAPHGRRCSYAQMGRCLSPCDGSLPMEEYRRVVDRAARFALGERARRAEELASEMKRSAAGLAFERAGVLKAKLDCLETFDRPEYAPVAEIKRFRFLAFQKGFSPRRAKVFLVDRGRVAEGAELDWPAEEKGLGEVLERMRGHVAASGGGAEDPWALGLAARYLRAGTRRKLAMLRWTESLGPAEALEFLREHAPALGLRAAKAKGQGGGPPAGL